MIGGEDIVISGRSVPDDLDFIVRQMALLWPDAVFEDALSDQGTVLDSRRFLGTRPRTSEFFVYRNAKSYHSWTEDGATDGNRDDMIHVILDDRQITLVVGRSESETDTLARRIGKMISNKRVFSRTANWHMEMRA